jgi:Xaa-Pro aminopeptidase
MQRSEYVSRRERLYGVMANDNCSAMLLPLSGDLEYLTGVPRRLPSFGNVQYAHMWTAGCFLAPGRDPVLVLPRMMASFDLPSDLDVEVRIVNERDDGVEIFSKVARDFRSAGRFAVGARCWMETGMRLQEALGDQELVSAEMLINVLRRRKSEAEIVQMKRACAIVDRAMEGIWSRVVPGVTELELGSELDYQMQVAGSRTVSFDTGVWSMGPISQRDATMRLSNEPLREGLAVSFDFGAVVDGYCSDFGRTVHVGEPSAQFRHVYDLVIEAQAAGIRAAIPGTAASQVDRATREVIVEGGYGEWFRHRTGHCIGLDVHERPFISEEESIELETGMTFTIEPSIFWPGHVGVRIEDIVVCTPTGGEKLNNCSEELKVGG